MLSGRQPPEDVEPLIVAVDARVPRASRNPPDAPVLWIVRGHRRGLALSALQGIWRHQTVWAPCLLYDAMAPEVALVHHFFAWLTPQQVGV